MPTNKFKPLCPYCREPWSDENVMVEDVYCSQGCDTCGSGAEASGTIVIKCHSCKKVMYKKDFAQEN
jgi:acetyl-CoA carboxylase beta subunit